MTSKETNQEILNILNKYLPDEIQKKMLGDLKEVKGNESFRKSMKAIYDNVRVERTITETPMCKVGVGDGMGELYVYGEYDAIKRVQDMIFENEELRSVINKVI